MEPSLRKKAETASGKSCRVRLIAPYPYTYRFRVRAKESGLTLIDLLALRFPFRSKPEWLERIRAGRVRVNGAYHEFDGHVKDGDSITHFNPRVSEPSVPDEVSVLRDFEDYLAVYKPAPMPVHPGGRYFHNTLIQILASGGFENLHIIHRLDSVTSGILLLGKSPAAADKARETFARSEVEKEYVALVSGIPERSTFSCDLPVRRERGFRFQSGAGEGAKPAQTFFEVLQEAGSNAIVRCRPVTGRTHQIRLHLQACGHPILNDPVYGPEAETEALQNTAIYLHHSGLRIPELGIDVTIPIPDHWKNAEAE